MITKDLQEEALKQNDSYWYGMEAIVPTFGPDVWKLVGSSLMHSIRTGSMN